MQSHIFFIFMGFAFILLALYIINFLLKVTSLAEEEQDRY